MFLVFQPVLMCETHGRLTGDRLEEFCNSTTDDDVSTATVVEILTRCPTCLFIANATRTLDAVSCDCY